MPTEKAKWKLHKDAASWFEQILETAPYKTAAVQPLTFHLLNHPNKIRKIRRVQLGKKEQSHKGRPPQEHLHMDTLLLAD